MNDRPVRDAAVDQERSVLWNGTLFRASERRLSALWAVCDAVERNTKLGETMRNIQLYVTAALALFSFSARAENQTEKVIDTFVDGALHQQMPATFASSYRAAPSALGKVRQTSALATDTQGLGLVSNLDIGGHHLIVSSGLYSSFGLYLGYGYDLNGNSGGMHENFSGCDRVRITFEASDLELGYAVQVWDGAGAVATLDGAVSAAGQLSPFSADFLKDDFKGSDAEGNPRPIDWTNITYVIVLFQSGSAIGANDFAVRSIVAQGGPTCAHPAAG